MTLRMALLFSLAFAAACTPEPNDGTRAEALPGKCQPLTHQDTPYIVCTFHVGEDDIRLFHSDAAGEPFLQFDALEREMDEQGKALIFAMNGGMYHEDRRPVGFYRDPYGDQASVNTNDGPGNFHMKPNGVFWLTGTNAGIAESRVFLEAAIDPDYATQSGPMLVIDGALHPDFNPDGVSRKRRNGVGVAADGKTVHFVISDAAVTFHDFAILFRDQLETPNALFLDGQVSRLYAPQLDRNEPGPDMGPIVGVVD